MGKWFFESERRKPARLDGHVGQGVGKKENEGPCHVVEKRKA